LVHHYSLNSLNGQVEIKANVFPPERASEQGIPVLHVTKSKQDTFTMDDDLI
jgi:hypothetical protein